MHQRSERFAESDDSLPSYLGRLTQTPLLSADEESELTRAVQAGNVEARERLIEANMRLVINVAKAYRNRAVPLEDLIQEGAIGLMQAAERFDPGKGYRFSTYATHWIRQAIGRAIDNKSKAIRLPAHVSQSLRRIERARAELIRQLGIEPSIEELALATQMSPRKLASLLQTAQETLSLDMSIGDSGSTTLAGMICDTSTTDPEAIMLSEEMRNELNGMIQQLSEREQRVMRHRFRLDEGSIPTAYLKEDGQAKVVDELGDHDVIARELQLSRERVRQIELQAIKKLRAIAQRRRLRDLLSR